MRLPQWHQITSRQGELDIASRQGQLDQEMARIRSLRLLAVAPLIADHSRASDAQVEVVMGVPARGRPGKAKEGKGRIRSWPCLLTGHTAAESTTKLHRRCRSHSWQHDAPLLTSHHTTSRPRLLTRTSTAPGAPPPPRPRPHPPHHLPTPRSAARPQPQPQLAALLPSLRACPRLAPRMRCP